MNAVFLAAAAALATPLPAATLQESPAGETSSNPVALHDHIRTTLHGKQGPLVVLIPGMSTPGVMWDDEVARLSPDHRVLVVELRGFDGERGTDNENEGALDGVVADIAADLASRNLGPATIAGHSLGGLIAMRLGLEHEELVSNLLIVDALPFFGTVFSPDMTLEMVQPQAERMRDSLIANAAVMRQSAKAGTASGAGAVGMSADEETRIQIANWAMRAEPLAVAQLVYEDTMTDLRQDIAALRMPVTVLHVANGQYADMAIERYATDYSALPNVKIVPVDETGHFVQLDKPAAFQRELDALIVR